MSVIATAILLSAGCTVYSICAAVVLCKIFRVPLR